jgi:hypothetical protein
LRLRFTVAGDRELALPGQSLTYTVSGQNRRTTTDTNAVVRLAYDPTMLRLQAAHGAARPPHRRQSALTGAR